MRRLIPLAFTLGLLAACATPLPRTEAQAAFTAQSAYVAAAHAGAAYVRSPSADPAVAARIRQLDERAYAAVVPLREAAQQGRAADAAQVLALQVAVESMTRYLASAEAK